MFCLSGKHLHAFQTNIVITREQTCLFLTTQYPTKQLTGKHLNFECWILCSVYLYFLCHLSLCTVDIISRQLLKEIEISDIQWDGLSVCHEFHLYSFVCQLHFWHCQIVSIQCVQVFFFFLIQMSLKGNLDILKPHLEGKFPCFDSQSLWQLIQLFLAISKAWAQPQNKYKWNISDTFYIDSFYKFSENL